MLINVSTASNVRLKFDDGDNETTEFMFVGINIFWARLRLILARAVKRGLR